LIGKKNIEAGKIQRNNNIVGMVLRNGVCCHLLFILCYILQILLIVPQELVESNEVSTSSASSVTHAVLIQSVKHQMYAVADDLYIQWGSTCNVLHEGWLDFSQLTVQDNDTILEINAGFGWTFVPLATLNTHGASLAIVKSSVDVQLLYKNLETYGLWNHSVIAAQRYDQDESFPRFSAVPNYAHHLLDNKIVNITFLKSFKYEEGGLSIHEFLADSIEYFRDHSVLIYLEISEHAPYLQEMIQLLLIFRYKIYFQPLSCYCRLDESAIMVRNGIIAVPHNYQHPTNHAQLLEYLHHLPEIRRSGIDFRKYSFKICEFIKFHQSADNQNLTAPYVDIHSIVNDPEINLETRNRTEDRPYYGLFTPFNLVKITGKVVKKTATVELDLLISSISPLRCILAEEIEQHQKLTVRYPMNDQSNIKSYRAVLHLECSDWIYPMITRAFRSPSMSVCSMNSGIDDLEQEILGLQMNCQNFLRERIYFLSNMYMKRWNETLISYNSFYALEEKHLTNETERKLLLSSVDSDDLGSFYTHYPEQNDDSVIPTNDNVSLKVDDWFHRQPFEQKDEPEFCGEPVFCSAANEVRRRLQLWQNPIKTQKELTDLGMTDPVAFQTHSTFYENRTCENAKFLIYEPQSNLNGIGSMLEMIASAMRFAICLDRILLLLPTKQSGYVLKWSPEGCQQNIFECYFQPLTHCPISQKDFDEAPIFDDGNGELDLTHYPYRRYRFLTYIGLPLDGPCALCYSDWPRESKFFDGTYMQHRKFVINKIPALLSHLEMFTGTIKLPWISQMMRYIFRPRPWFADLLKEITYHSMVSPLQVNSNSTINNDDSQEKFLQPIRFPEKFISLHVRFGAKVVEVQKLEPLTKYMTFMKKKLPFISDIFVSTETEDIIPTLIQ
jgi:hypothetical protein